MPRALWSAVSGLDNHQTWMDVIGNNIANVNTAGYKDSRFQFEDILSQSLRGAAPPTQGGSGGTNPEQVGLGSTTGSVETNTAQGSLQQTGLPTDLAIQGPGYFVVGDGQNLHYTRDSVFHVDASGSIVSSSNGLHLQGIVADANGNLALGAANGLRNMTIPQTVNNAVATTELDGFGNLDSRATQPVTQQIQVFDSLGQQHTVVLRFDPGTGGTGNWNLTATSPDLAGNPTILNTTVSFNGQGQLTSAGQLQLNTGGSAWLIPSSVTSAGNGTASIAATGQAINLDLNDAQVGNLTSFAAASSVSSQIRPSLPGAAGQAAASLQSFTIGADGVLRGQYSNGTNKTLGQIQLATFTNPGGLQRIGQNDWDVTADSGQANVTNPGAGAAGTVAQGNVETSNVQLADQLSEMILSERGFQANSRVITTSDEMLQDVVQMKR
jgi:flagellar hook protein FlgE